MRARLWCGVAVCPAGDHSKFLRAVVTSSEMTPALLIISKIPSLFYIVPTLSSQDCAMFACCCSSDCCSKLPQTGWLKGDTYFSQFWRQEVQDQSARQICCLTRTCFLVGRRPPSDGRESKLHSLPFLIDVSTIHI